MVDLEDQEWEVTQFSTACYGGYFCRYSFKDKNLVLSAIYTLNKFKTPAFGGIEANRRKTGGFWKYAGLDLPIEYSGGIVIGRGFLDQFYVHMGFHRPHCFKNVRELIVDKGRLIECVDHSNRIEEIRNRMRSKEVTNDSLAKDEDGVVRFIQDSLSLWHEKKWAF